MSALGSLVVKLALEHAEFTKGLDKSSQEALRFAKNTQDAVDRASSSFKSAVSSVLGYATAFVSVGVAIAGLKSSINNLAELNDMASKLGDSASELSRLQKVAVQFGTDFGQVETALTKFTKNLGDATGAGKETYQALNTLGVSATDLSGNLKPPSELLIEVAKSLQGYEDGAGKAAVATALFGKAGAELIPYLGDLARNIERFTGVSNEAALKADEFNDKLGMFKEKTDSAFQSLAEKMLPTLDAMLTKFIENAEKGRAFIGVLESIGELSKSVFFGSERSRQEERFQFGIPAEMTRIASRLKNQSLDSFERVKLETELKFLAKEQNALALQLGKIKKDAETIAQPEEKKKLEFINSVEAERLAKEQKRIADLAQKDALKALQDEIEEELEAADTISAYKQKKLEELTKAKKEADKEEYERQLKQLDVLQKQANENFDEAQRKAKEVAEEAKRAAEDLNRSLTDALLRGFESGKDFARNFRDTLVNLFQTLVLRPIINFVLNQSGITGLLGGIGSLFSGNAIAGETGGGFGGLFSSVKDIFTSTNGSIVSSIQDLGVYLSSGNGGLGDVLGGFLGENASAISDGFGYLGAAFQLAQGNIGGALGTAVGTFFGGPLGGAIGSFLGGALGGLFGGGLPPRVTESRSATTSGGVTSFYEGADPGKRKLGASSQLDALNETFAKNLNTLFGAFDVDAEITSNSLLTKKKNTRSRFWASLNGEFLGFDDASFGKKGTMEEAFNSLVERALGSYTVTAIKASDLPEGIKKFFDGLVKKEEVAETINTLIGMKKALVDLPPIFNAVRNALDTTAYTTSLDQLKAQFEATQNFVNLFYTDAEKFDIFTQQLNSQLEALNQTLPSSRDEYRALVESINVVDAATRDQFNGLIALAPAMDQYFNQLKQQADGIREVNEALAEGLDRNLFSTFADYASARASVANGITATGFMGDLSVRRSQGDAELANAVKSLVAQQARTDLILAEIAAATRKTADVNERWDGNGLPQDRGF